MTLEEVRRVVIPACRQFNVKRLDVFGSLTRDATTPSSDVDLIVEFQESGGRLSKRFFGLLHHLEDHLGCEIDLLTASGLKNPYFRRKILSEWINLYGE